MADVKSYVGKFTIAALATGAQVIDGIVDGNGHHFTPKAVIFFTCRDGFYDSTGQYAIACFGFDDGVTAVNWSHNSNWLGGGIGSTGGGENTYSIGNNTSFFSPSVTTQAKVSAFASGQFTIAITRCNNGAVVGYMALGGADLLVHVGTTNVTGAGSQAVTGVGFTPTGLIVLNNGVGTGVGATANNPDPAIGFIGSDFTGVSLATGIKDGSATPPSYSYQRTDFAQVFLDTSAGTATNRFTVTAWGADGFTINAAVNPNRFVYLAIGGVPVVAGSFLQPAASGLQDVTVTGILPAGALFMTTGKTAGSTVVVNMGLSLGAAGSSGSAHAGWIAALSGCTSAGQGGMTWGTAKAVLTATPVGQLSSNATITGEMEVVGWNNGSFGTQWTNCDGTLRQVLFLAFGSVYTPPVTVTRQIRRLRRFPLPYDRSFALFISRVEFLIQAGVGDPDPTAQGYDPQISVRFSPDGGKTWGYWITTSMGKSGDYSLRPALNQIGKVINGLVEVVVADPVYTYLLDCYIEATQGTV